MAVNTTAGEVRGPGLGFTSMHEHVACWLSPGVRDNYLWDPRSDSRGQALAQAVHKVSLGRDAGIETIVDLTTVDIGRDVPFIAEVSKRTGVSIIVAAGLFARSPPGAWSFFQAIGLDATADLMTRDIEVGVMGTDVKAGVLKAAIAPPGFANINADGIRAAAELKNLPRSMWGEFGLRVVARAHRRTGALINVHTHTPTRTGLATCDILEEEGVDLSRVLIHHVGNHDGIDYLDAMLARGAYLSMDPHRGAWHYKTIATLCAKGFADRLTLGIDSVQVTDWDPLNEFEGEERARLEMEWAVEYLPLQVVPNLREVGVSEESIRAMTVSTPARLMEFASKTVAADNPVLSPITADFAPSKAEDGSEDSSFLGRTPQKPKALAATACREGCDHTH